MNASVRCSESLFDVDHGFDTVVHILNEVDFGATESTEVGDVEDAVVSLSVLTVSTADLDIVLVGDGLELFLLLTKLGELDVDRGAHTSTEVGGAVRDVTKMLVVGKLGLLLDLGRGNGESLEDLADVGALLHGDDTELILFVNPDEESLGFVVEDTTGLRPLALETARLEVLVTTLEEEVISDELLLIGFRHGGEGVVLSSELTVEFVQGRHNLGLDLTTLFSSDGGTERVVSEVTSNSDSGGVDHGVLVSGEVRALKLGVVHVDDVLVSGRVTVVLLDDFVEERGEFVVALVAAGVNTNAGVGPLAAREDGLLEGEATLVNAILALLPHVTSENLGEEGLGAFGEDGELGDLRGTSEMGSHHHFVGAICAVAQLKLNSSDSYDGILTWLENCWPICGFVDFTLRINYNQVRIILYLPQR